jgi:hypothetical protein
MSTALTADVPLPAHAKAMRALQEFDAIVSQYEMLLDTQQVLVRTVNFAALFEMASRGDRLARDAAMCGKRFTPIVDAVTSGQFVGPRATELRRLSFAAKSHAETLGGSASRLANACRDERDTMGREIRRTNPLGAEAGLPPAYRVDAERLLDRSV